MIILSIGKISSWYIAQWNHYEGQNIFQELYRIHIFNFKSFKKVLLSLKVHVSKNAPKVIQDILSQMKYVAK